MFLACRMTIQKPRLISGIWMLCENKPFGNQSGIQIPKYRIDPSPPFSLFACSFCRVATNVRELSPFTWSLGTRTSSTSWTCARTTARKNSAPVISSTPCGSRTSSCAVWRRMACGVWCARMPVPDFKIVGEKNLMSCTRDTRKRGNSCDRLTILLENFLGGSQPLLR